MFNNLEVRFINLIQCMFFTEEFNHPFIGITDYVAKFITSRKYKKYILTAYIIYMIIYNINYNYIYLMLSVPKFYLFSLLSRSINIKIKLFSKRKRPYVDHQTIKVLEKTKEKKKNTYSFPSNSIQTSLIFYGFMLRTMDLGTCYNSIILTLIVLITSFAKINRGMHYPSDILFSIGIYYILLNLYV